MKATIEIGRAPRKFWLAAAAMVAEHAGYYARENGFRVNVAMFQAMCDAHNAGVAPLAIQHTINGCHPAVRAAMDEEGISETFELQQKCWGVVDASCTTGGDHGADWCQDAKGIEVGWTTSNGNSLSIRLDGEWVTCTVEGRRHGIPWRFLVAAGVQENDLLVLGQDSQSTAKPWQNGVGENLVRFTGREDDNLADVTTTPKPGEWPSWGDHHQQAGWVADKVCAANTFAEFCRTCAKYVVPSTAVRYTPSNSYGVFVLRPAGWSIDWTANKRLFSARMESRRNCAVPIARHDTTANWRRFVHGKLQPKNGPYRHYPMPPRGNHAELAWTAVDVFAQYGA